MPLIPKTDLAQNINSANFTKYMAVRRGWEREQRERERERERERDLGLGSELGFRIN
jgi:hypothetical protein